MWLLAKGKITKVSSLSDRKDAPDFNKGSEFKKKHDFVEEDYESNFGYTSLKANMSLTLKIDTSLKTLYQDCFFAPIKFLEGLSLGKTFKTLFFCYQLTLMKH